MDFSTLQGIPQGVVGWVTPDYQLKTYQPKRNQHDEVLVDENGSIVISRVNKKSNGVYRLVLTLCCI